VASTRSRPRGRENARSISGGAAAEHATKIYGIAIGAVVAIVAFLALTSTGHVIDAATQHFMLYYAGVFALIALCASVALGLIATDRMILHPGHRIFVQSAHRAASFGAVAFLIIHIVTEILAQRVHVLDAVVPFLSPFRTFYIGLGTIASDLVLLLVITGILRKRFTAHGKAWRWRAIHYTSYVAFVFGVWHGLLGGRAGKPYVDWSYGFVVAMVALGLAVRILANSLRPKETLSGPPVPESASSGSAPMRAASMFAQLGIVRAATTSAAVLEPSGPAAILAAPVDRWTASPVTGPAPAYAALPAPPGPYEAADGRQPLYEPGYEGPPRYLGAPRSGNTGPLPRANSGPMPRANSGPMPRANSGPIPRANSGPIPRANTGPIPRANTGPIPQMPGYPAIGRGTGPMPRANSGPMPRANSGPMPRAASGPMPRAASGPMPGAASGPMPRAQSGPMPPAAPGPMPSPGGRQPRRGSPVPPGRRDGEPGGAPPRGAHRGGQPAGWNSRRPGRPATPGWAGAAGWDGSPDWASTTGWDGSSDLANATGWDGAPGWGGGAGAGEPGYGQADYGQLGYAQADYGQPDYGQPEYAQPDYGQPPWEGGIAGPDPGFRYRDPGPGMPGYRGPGNRFRGDDRR
jgi:DMSO/TMAO reductase YedYZ heme-binding membrane subunit